MCPHMTLEEADWYKEKLANAIVSLRREWVLSTILYPGIEYRLVIAI